MTTSKDNRLYCICRTINDPTRPMIMCEKCKEWYHMSCFGIVEEEVDDDFPWMCRACLDIISEFPSFADELLGFQGRVTPKSGWTNKVYLQEFPDSALLPFSKISSRISKEAYKLWHSGCILQSFSNETLLPMYLFYKGNIKASMKGLAYSVNVCYNADTLSVNWAHCGCPAGIDGECKHVLALLFNIKHYVMLGEDFFPEPICPTQQAQVWHIKKPVSDDAFLFCEVKVEKVDQRPKKRGLGDKIENFSSSVSLKNYVTRESLKSVYDAIKSKNLPILQTWKSSDFTPVIPKESRVVSLSDVIFQKIDEGESLCEYKSHFAAEISKFEKFHDNVIAVTIEEAKRIEEATRMQSRSLLWRKERLYRFTASNFHKFVHLKPSTNPILAYQQTLCIPYAPSLRHGKFYEPQAIKLFLDTQKIFSNSYVEANVGLVVNPKIPFLGASPDFCVLDNGNLCLLEVKCPYSLFRTKKKIIERAKEANFYLEFRNGQLQVNQKHKTFLQIQGQLNICNISTAYLVLYVPPNDLEFVLVERCDIGDEIFKLTKLWCTVLLPHFFQEICQ